MVCFNWSNKFLFDVNRNCQPPWSLEKDKWQIVKEMISPPALTICMVLLPSLKSDHNDMDEMIMITNRLNLLSRVSIF